MGDNFWEAMKDIYIGFGIPPSSLLPGAQVSELNGLCLEAMYQMKQDEKKGEVLYAHYRKIVSE